MSRHMMRVDMNNTDRFVSLEEMGLEEDNNDDPCHGTHLSTGGSIYSYTDWYYDGDESAFSIM